jgi:hypothetical protein
MSKVDAGRDLTLWIAKDGGGVSSVNVTLCDFACNILKTMLKDLSDDGAAFLDVRAKDEETVIVKKDRLVCAFSPSGLKEKYSKDGGWRSVTLVFSNGEVLEVVVEIGSSLAAGEAIKTGNPFVSILNGPRLVMVCRAESIVCARIPSDRPRNEDEVRKAIIPSR